MNKLKLILIVLFVLQGVTICAQKVSNITFHQEQSNIIVSYDLDTKTPCKVSLYFSTNGGNTWQGPLTKVSGDVGNKVYSGSYNINWTVLEEFEELRGDKIMFQVRTEDFIKTVKIGTQYWTTKNLNVTKYNNGDVIPEVKDPKEWVKLTTGAWCYLNNDPNTEAIFGKLYNWYAIHDSRGLAPTGFHIPSVNEFKSAFDYLGIKKVKLKNLPSIEKYNCPNTKETNAIGFYGVEDCGRVASDGDFYKELNTEHHPFSTWWTSTPSDDKNSEYYYYFPIGPLGYTSEGSNTKCVWGLPTRLIKD